MYAGSTCRALLSLVLIAVFAGAALAASPGDVVINELYVNTADYFDGSEYIELYNTTGDSIDLDGWVLSSVEYDEICGEHHHELPETTWIEPYGYVIIATTTASKTGSGSCPISRCMTTARPRMRWMMPGSVTRHVRTPMPMTTR